MTVKREGSDEPLPRRLHLTFEAEVTDGGDKARFTLDVPSVPGGIPGPDLEFVVVDRDVIYFRPLADPKTLPKGEEWFLLSPERVRRLGFGQYLDFVTNDRFLTTNDYTSDEDIGTEEVRGTETTIYEFREDIEEMASVIGIPEGQLESMRDVVGDDLYMKLWVDREGFTRRVDIPMQVPERLDVEGVVVTRLEFYDFNEDIEIELPDLSTVTIP